MGDWTPGPWGERKGGGHATFYVEGPSHRGSSEQVPRTWLVAEVSGRSLDENEANARLIAAAPDMAELLKQALELESMSGCPACCEGNDDEGACLYHGIRALFAKVNGESDE